MADLSVATLLREQVPAHHRRVLEAATELAQQLGDPLYLVGGAVRDLLRTGELRDLDLVVEGDGLEFARQLAAKVEAELRLHPRFLTAELDLEGLRVDVTTARRESYLRAGELPEVEVATLNEDLGRRDFTINAMALRLWPETAAAPIDPFDGGNDLAKGLLRVLHDQSFLDDPTRILRGVRLAARLGLRLETKTRDLMLAAVTTGAFNPLSASRLLQEMVLILDESESVEESIRLLDQLQFLTYLHSEFTVDPELFQKLRASKDLQHGWSAGSVSRPPVRWWLARLLVLLSGHSRAVRAGVADRLGLEGEMRSKLLGRSGAVATAKSVLQTSDVAPHRVHQALESLASEELVSLALTGKASTRAWIERWLDELRRLGLGIGGEDLVARGIPEGPEIGRVLETTLAARMDGTISREDEMEYALDLLKEDKQQ